MAITVKLPTQLRDTVGGGHPAQAASGTFDVAVADSANPTATIAAPNILDSSGERQKITVSYNDDIAVDITSIQGSTDLVTTGPDGVTELVPVSVTTSSATNAPSIVV
ncbi:MAG: hypothetical protein KY433_11520, partial [Actinobacteria bacterium]|nr:hypothetical protein [Actinomycetota bacterium]